LIKEPLKGEGKKEASLPPSLPPLLLLLLLLYALLSSLPGRREKRLPLLLPLGWKGGRGGLTHPWPLCEQLGLSRLGGASRGSEEEGGREGGR